MRKVERMRTLFFLGTRVFLDSKLFAERDLPVMVVAYRSQILSQPVGQCFRIADRAVLRIVFSNASLQLVRRFREHIVAEAVEQRPSNRIGLVWSDGWSRQLSEAVCHPEQAKTGERRIEFSSLVFSGFASHKLHSGIHSTSAPPAPSPGSTRDGPSSTRRTPSPIPRSTALPSPACRPPLPPALHRRDH